MKNKAKKAAYSFWDKVMVFKEPSDDSDVIDVIYKEEVFYILNNIIKSGNSEWIQVETRAKYVGFINGNVRHKVINERIEHEETFIVTKVLVFFFLMGSAVIYSNTSHNLTFIERVRESISSEIYFILGLVLFYLLYQGTVRIARKRRLRKISRIKEHQK